MKRLAAVLVAVVAMLAVASPAAAHVTVNPKEATQGSFARLAFRVPNESDSESTTKLEVQMPENAPLASVSTQPVPGWTVSVTKRKLDKPIDVHGSPVSEVVSVVTWTAAPGAAIKPGEFQEFAVSAGPLPTGVDQVLFKALQTYSDGTIVRWIDPPAEGAEHPAPVLKLLPAAATASQVPLAEKESGSGSGLGWAALGVSVLALILGGLALLRSRRA